MGQCENARMNTPSTRPPDSTALDAKDGAASNGGAGRAGHPALVLASSSPYRRMLLERLGLPFTWQKPATDETAQPGEAPVALATRLATEKALAVATKMPGAIVIGSDQVAECEGEVLDKPGNFARALAQLQRQRGRQTQFHTAVCLVSPTGETRQTVVTTVVTWQSAAALTDERLAQYLTLEPAFDCAGAAKSEGLGLCLLEKIECDDPTALVGLPMVFVSGVLRDWGLDPLRPPSRS